MDRLKFSLVTTCRNEIKSLPRWKKNVLEQSRQPNEIVIVDAFSDDGTYEMLLEWSEQDNRVKLIQEKGAAAHGRNVAIEHAIHEHILSTDMGVRLNKIWCEELITPFETDSSIDVVAGNTCIDKETVKSAVARAEYYIENGGMPKLGPGFVPGNRSIAYTKKVWKQLGGLPEDLTFYADDSVFGRQMIQEELKFAYAPEAMTYWGRPKKLRQFWKEQYNYGRGDGEAFIKTPRVFKWYFEKKIPAFLVPMLHPLIQLIKINSYNGIHRAIRKSDIGAAFFIPNLIFFRSYFYAKAYLIGFKNGNNCCVNCRNRLKRDKKGYSHI
ncbi:MAG TPA: glycosyltransferase [Thermotogaceae bacterium]|nr:glycosyltransferase [Thermotogaceae bacterium]